MIGRNWRELKYFKLGSLYSIGLSAFALCGALGFREWPGVVMMLGAGWFLAVAAETRVFIPVIPYAAALIVGAL